MSKIDYQALRAKAEKATCGEWSLEYGEGRFDGDDALIHREAAGYIPICRIEGAHPESGFDEDFQMEQQANAEFIAAASPATVLALLDEREADKKRIAELEAREIKPAQGEVFVVVSGFTGCGKSAIAGEIEIAMKAIGVPVQWTNGDAEKRMTGADWLTAIEMYKPTVRIMEVNVPRAAGIRIKEGDMDKNITAYWSLSLDAECPKCGHNFDLLCDPDFWEFSGAKQACEEIKGYETCCPECNHEFKTDFVY